MECLEPKSLIGAPMQFDPRFWGFKLEEQRAGTTFTICIETFDCYNLLCIGLSVYRDGDTRVLLLRGINGRLIFVGIVCGVYMQGTASKTSFKV